MKVYKNIDSFMDLNEKIISSNTVNTWQKDRSMLDIGRDTNLGKIAENIISNYINYETSLNYLSYDEFRQNNYKKHAQHILGEVHL